MNIDMDMLVGMIEYLPIICICSGVCAVVLLVLLVLEAKKARRLKRKMKKERNGTTETVHKDQKKADR